MIPEPNAFGAPEARDTRLSALLNGSPYQAYGYAYPHKSAYHLLPESVHLESAWATESRDSLFLYVHVPFCKARCGYCNLFTTVGQGEDTMEEYLDAIQRHARTVKASLGHLSFAQFALGGGTPTALSTRQLSRIFGVLETELSCNFKELQSSVEVSPDSASEDKLRVLSEAGVQRVSIGVEAFDEAGMKALGRPQKALDVRHALERLKATFPVVNVDLIYGAEATALECFLKSVQQAVDCEVEEVFLYPLYVRPLTGLGKKDSRGADRRWDAHRLACYRESRALLLSAGYQQRSMRMFRRKDAPDCQTTYSCQRDGMIGLGPGARSYTTTLHYSTRYAVEQKASREILREYCKETNFEYARHGYWLSPEERRRRFLLQSLLLCEGLRSQEYLASFGARPDEHFPELLQLKDYGLAQSRGDRWTLTELGLERSDAITPFFTSDAVRRRMEAFEWK